MDLLILTMKFDQWRILDIWTLPTSNVREARLNTHGQKFDPESLYEPI